MNTGSYEFTVGSESVKVTFQYTTIEEFERFIRIIKISEQ